jgi:hypothetical protein
MQLKSKTTPTLQELTEVSVYKNSEVVRYYAGMNMRSALATKAPSLGILSKTDEVTVKRCITNMLIGTSMYFDSILSQNKADVIAEELLANYNYRQLKLEDVLAVCIEIKEADIYKLTPARILKHVAIYTQKREDLAIQTSITSSQNHKSDLGESDIDKRIMNSIRHIERSNDEVAKGRVFVQKYYK